MSNTLSPKYSSDLRSSRFWRLRVAMLALAATSGPALLAAGQARAEAADEDPVAKITQLNRDAVAAYQAQRYEEARKMLKQALDVAGESGLDQHPIKARTHVHMGIVIIVGFKQRDVGMKQFRKALDIQADIALTKGLVTPDLQAAFDEAKGGPAAASAAPEPPAAPPAPPPAAAAPGAPSSGLVHEAVTVGQRGSPISISATVQSELGFDKLVLAYRPDGGTDFFGREMKQVSDGVYAAEIPNTATMGRSVAYYIEAEDKEGAPMAARGSADSPLVISLAGAGRPQAVARSEDEDEDDEDSEEGGRKLFVGLLLGSGLGWASGNGDTNADVMINPAGIAVAELGHFAPEVGYWVRPNLMISGQGRFQRISGTTDVYSGGRVYHTANYAAALFAKVTWRFGSKTWRPFISVAAGGGQIRHVVTFNKLKCGQNSTETCVDTIAGGPIVLGPGGGVAMDLNEHFSLLLQLNSQLAFPKFTANLDANLGVAMMF